MRSSIEIRNPGDVKRILRDWPKLRANAYDAGDYDALILLVDLEAAITAAGLTAKQLDALRLVYLRDSTQAKAAAELGVTRQAIGALLDNAAKQIATIYGEWATYERTDDI